MRAKAGSFESGDCIITITDSTALTIEIESTVMVQFGDQIHDTILEVLKTHNITKVHVQCQDKGALDYTIKARTVVALKRGGYIE
jgi:citrate lyase subunit gamma (acyl carrier protein)